MQRKCFMVCSAALVLSTATGCTDNWAAFAREERNLKNELADYMMRIVDEDSATEVVTGPAERMKKKWTDHKDRLDIFLKAQDMNQIQQAFQQLAGMPKGEVRYGIGANELIFTKAEDGTIAAKGAFKGAQKDAIDLITDPDFGKTMAAAEKRLVDQTERIRRIQPAGPNLDKATEMNKGIFR